MAAADVLSKVKAQEILAVRTLRCPENTSATDRSEKKSPFRLRVVPVRPKWPNQLLLKEKIRDKSGRFGHNTAKQHFQGKGKK